MIALRLCGTWFLNWILFCFPIIKRKSDIHNNKPKSIPGLFFLTSGMLKQTKPILVCPAVYISVPFEAELCLGRFIHVAPSLKESQCKALRKHTQHSHRQRLSSQRKACLSLWHHDPLKWLRLEKSLAFDIITFSELVNTVMNNDYRHQVFTS